MRRREQHGDVLGVEEVRARRPVVCHKCKYTVRNERVWAVRIVACMGDDMTDCGELVPHTECVCRVCATDADAAKRLMTGERISV